jgi:hypothetical protein
MTKPIEAILAEKPKARPRIYAYSIADDAHAGLLKIGQTTRDVKQRIAKRCLQNVYEMYYFNTNNTCQASQRCSNRRVFFFLNFP